MGRILYGVMGDRGGHLSRSIAIAHQLPGHEIVFIGGGRIAEVADHGFDYILSPMIGTEMRSGRLDLPATVAGAIKGFARQHRTIADLKSLIRDFDPDLILSDFEYFLPRAARAMGRPAISIDRHHALTHCHYPRPPGGLAARALSLSILKTMFGTASRYLVVSFAPLNPLDPARTEVFPPVVREHLNAHQPVDDGHAVVYLYGVGLDRIRALFAGRKRRFVIYGQGRDGDEGNLSFRHHSTDGFLADLASAAYVVSHGGHNLISEALHFRKPLLAVPLAYEYEQYFNAWLLQESGLGLFATMKNSATALDHLESGLDRYRSHLAKYRPWSKVTVADRIERMIKNGEGRAQF